MLFFGHGTSMLEHEMASYIMIIKALPDTS